tara:strand:- start:311 stop:1834 length:1524 start_codon:yes stop_codon:yes gene_type:complete
MANVVLRTNLANNNILVEQKVLKVPIQEESVELKITAKDGFTINAQDFHHGYLPKTVRSINYTNSGDDIIATVILNSGAINKQTRVIYLPVSAIVKATRSTIKLTETLEKDHNIITNVKSKFPKSIINNKTIYSFKGDPNQKIYVYKRSFRIIDGYNFESFPSYIINKNKDRYKIKEEFIRANGKIIGKSFDVHYTLPSENMDSQVHEDITFVARSIPERIEPGSEVATKKEEYKIYSFDPGTNIGAQGGVRKISVKGVPGTKFKLMLQDSAKKTYNPKTGVYEAGGGMIEGTIPDALPGIGYGEYVKAVKVPRSTATISYQDRIIQQTPIDHSKIVDTKTATAQTSIKQEIKDVKVAPESYITISMDTTGSFTTNWEDVVLGPGDFGNTIEGKTYTFSVKPASGNNITIDRQPLQDPNKAFTAWDSGDKADADTSAGVAIENDWYNTRVATDGVEETSKVFITTVGEANDDAREVTFKIAINKVTFGEGNNTYKLKLLNFLTQTSL